MVESEKEILEANGTATAPGQIGLGTMADTRLQLRGTDGNGAELLATEMFCLDFRNRCGLGGRIGLDSASWTSGAVGYGQYFALCQEGRLLQRPSRGLLAVHLCSGLHSCPAH